MMSAVNDALCAAAPHIESALAAAASAADDANMTMVYSELLRFDFVIGRVDGVAENSGGGVEGGGGGRGGGFGFKPWLIEVNASPNLEPSSQQQEKFLRCLVADVAGRCRLPVSKPELRARLVSALETKMR